MTAQKIKMLLWLETFFAFGSILSFLCGLRTPNVPGVHWQSLKGVYGGEMALIQPYFAQ